MLRTSAPKSFAKSSLYVAKITFLYGSRPCSQGTKRRDMVQIYHDEAASIINRGIWPFRLFLAPLPMLDGVCVLKHTFFNVFGIICIWHGVFYKVDKACAALNSFLCRLQPQSCFSSLIPWR